MDTFGYKGHPIIKLLNSCIQYQYPISSPPVSPAPLLTQAIDYFLALHNSGMNWGKQGRQGRLTGVGFLRFVPKTLVLGCKGVGV
nr:hypothetical protein [Dendronalium sp. ChiSLP03b]MDZ8203172.1 hypothetical protein [Dendronalium sp. ChiSLP03b]